MNRKLSNSSKRVASDGQTKRETLEIGAIALALFVILGFLVPLSAQAPAKQGEVPEILVAVTSWSTHRCGTKRVADRIRHRSLECDCRAAKG